MQKLIAKYGTAAHLAILAVAPLFLFPFCTDVVLAKTVLWLSLIAVGWAFLEPSMRSGEMLHDARARVVGATLRDPVFWLMVLLVGVAGLRALNDGIALAYDPEETKWMIRQASATGFPGCARGCGFLPFAATVMAAVLVQGCRHSLGSSARMAFALVSATLAGLSGLFAIYLVNQGNPVLLAAAGCPLSMTSFVGTGFLVYFLWGTLAAVGAFERKWFRVMPLFVFAIGGTAAAGFVFSPARNTVVFVLAEAVLLAYLILYSFFRLSAGTEFKVLVLLGLGLALGGMLVMTTIPAGLLDARLAAFAAGDFLPEDLLTLRRTMSGLAVRVWKASPWMGTGLGAFPLGLRFEATPADWAVIPPGAATLAHGYWLLLAERGVVGATLLVLPVGFLSFVYFRRAFVGFSSREWPHPAVLVGLLVTVAIGLISLYDASFLRGEVLAAVGASLALSANSFPKGKRGK